jgi:hypothetical protein
MHGVCRYNHIPRRKQLFGKAIKETPTWCNVRQMQLHPTNKITQNTLKVKKAMPIQGPLCPKIKV